jgi:hypothetical protein
MERPFIAPRKKENSIFSPTLDTMKKNAKALDV